MDAQPLYTQIRECLSTTIKHHEVPPRLTCLLTTTLPQSERYVALKAEDCRSVGIHVDVAHHPNIGESDVLTLIHRLNQSPAVDAVLLQLPFAPSVSMNPVYDALSPAKDVEGLTPHRLGKLFRGEYSIHESIVPCTPKGIMRLLHYYNVPIAGRDAVVVGRSILVGESMRKMLEDADATASCLHTQTRDLTEKLLNADLIVSAVGDPSFRLTGDMVKDNAVVVGVGSHRLPNGHLRFDVDFKDVAPHTSFITPNIGGVGLMTRAMLMENTVLVAYDHD